MVKLCRAGAVIWGFLSCQLRRQIGRGGARRGERKNNKFKQKKKERKSDARRHPRPGLALVPVWQWVPQAVWPAVARDRAGAGIQHGSATPLALSASSGSGGSEVPLQHPGPQGPQVPPWGSSPIPLGTAAHWDTGLIPVLLPGRTRTPCGTQPTLNW